MPGVVRYITDPNSRTKEHREQEDKVRAELNIRTKRIKLNWDYYEGDHRKHLADDNTNTDDNVVFNLYGLGVDKGVSDVVASTEDGVISGPKFDIVGDESPLPRIVREIGRIFRPAAQKSVDQLYLDAVWDVNNKELFLHNLALSSGVTGHSFIKIIPDTYASEEFSERKLARLILLNPCHVTAFWEEGDKDKVLAFRIEYGREGNAKRQDIVWQAPESMIDDYGNESMSDGVWIIYDYEQRDNRRTWGLVNEQIWSYEWSPIVQWQNMPNPNDFYGREDISKADRGLNDSLNFVSSNMQRIIKYHADPTTVATGTKESDIKDTAINRLLSIENENAKVYNVEMESDLESSMAFSKVLRRGYFDGIRELDPATVEDRLGDLTNFGLRVLYGDKTKKTATKRMMCGMGLTDINQRVLELGAFGAKRKVAIKWPAILPDDPLIQTQALDMDTQHGTSQETYLEKRGYDPQLEMMRREREQAEQTTNAVTLRQGEKLDALRNGVNGNAKQTTA